MSGRRSAPTLPCRPNPCWSNAGRRSGQLSGCNAQAAEICQSLEHRGRIGLELFKPELLIIRGIGEPLPGYEIGLNKLSAVIEVRQIGRGRIARSLKFQLTAANARCGRVCVANDVHDSRSRKNFEPGRSKYRRARFFPTPLRTKVEPRPEPKYFRIEAIAKDPSEIAADICPQVGNAIQLSFRCLDPFQEWLGIIPGRSDSSQIVLV